jgi:hypothetical protein
MSQLERKYLQNMRQRDFTKKRKNVEEWTRNLDRHFIVDQKTHEKMLNL